MCIFYDHFLRVIHNPLNSFPDKFANQKSTLQLAFSTNHSSNESTELSSENVTRRDESSFNFAL